MNIHKQLIVARQDVQARKTAEFAQIAQDAGIAMLMEEVVAFADNNNLLLHFYGVTKLQ